MVDSAVSATSPSFSVLVVCTANRYRSAAGEHLLRQAAAQAGLHWHVISAGTHANPGEPMDPRTAEILAERGMSPAAWRTRRLGVGAVAGADLILVAADEHRRRVVALKPAAVHRTFPLLQFARLARAARADGPAIGDGRLLLEQARRVRARVQPVPPGTDDVPDPVGKPARVLRACVEQIEGAIEQIVSAARP